MAKKNSLTDAPPYAISHALRRLGVDLRTARLSRNLTIDEVAQKIGTGRRAVMDAEKGRPGVSAAAYLALLWAYGLLEQMSEVADPAKDEEGLALRHSRSRARTRVKGRLDNEF